MLRKTKYMEWRGGKRGQKSYVRSRHATHGTYTQLVWTESARLKKSIQTRLHPFGAKVRPGGLRRGCDSRQTRFARTTSSRSWLCQDLVRLYSRAYQHAALQCLHSRGSDLGYRTNESLESRVKVSERKLEWQPEELSRGRPCRLTLSDGESGGI